VRIIAGSRKGHTINAPKGLDTRPTGDRVREAAFNLIGPVDGASVLDLFAGSGAMGLEALSRGAGGAVFVESDREACRAIERNLEKLRLTGARVVCEDTLRFLATERNQYDLVLVDPPYELVESLQVSLSRYLPAVLAEDGLLVFETSTRDEPELPLAKRTSRSYGSARLTLFEHCSRPSGAAGGAALRPAGADAGERREA
jgi:16S rRNA (guanine966-N2)-methyltransferase